MHAANWTFWKKGLAGVFLLLCASSAGRAQASIPTSALMAELNTLSAHAATVFVGQIVSIQRRNSVVEISFRVEQPVRGAAAKVIVLREWAGLWAPGASRYMVGQRVLAFLRGSSRAGFNSPVHGAEGLVPVVVQGADHPELLDVRRVAASVVRSPGTPLPAGDDGALQLKDVLSEITGQAHALAGPVRFPLPDGGRSPLDLLSASAPNASLNQSGRHTLFTSTGPEITDAHR